MTFRASTNALAFGLYLVLCGISFLTAYQLLGRAEAGQLKAVQNGTLFYVSKDAHANGVAQDVSKLGVKTVDLLSPEAGHKVYELTGARTATSPTLVLPQEGVHSGVQIAAGPLAVETALRPLFRQITPFVLGQRALLVMGALILLALLFSSEIANFVALLPLLGVAAVSAMGGGCLACSSSGSTSSSLAPLASLLYVGAMWARELCCSPFQGRDIQKGLFASWRCRGWFLWCKPLYSHLSRSCVRRA